MHRREFLIRTATAAGAAWLSSKSILSALSQQTLGKNSLLLTRSRSAAPESRPAGSPWALAPSALDTTRIKLCWA